MKRMIVTWQDSLHQRDMTHWLKIRSREMCCGGRLGTGNLLVLSAIAVAFVITLTTNPAAAHIWSVPGTEGVSALAIDNKQSGFYALRNSKLIHFSWRQGDIYCWRKTY